MKLKNLLINGLILIVSLEVAGHIIYSYTEGSFFYSDKVAALSSASQSETKAIAPGRLWKERQVIHPYSGFVDDLTYLKSTGDDKLRTKLGFLRATHQSEDFPFFDPTRLNVGVFGGSVATSVCYHFPIIAESLQELATVDDKLITPFCYALGGKKQPDQLQTLSYLYALGAHFDIVINLDGFNEVAIPIVENHLKGVNPFFPRSWHLQAAPSEVGRTLSQLTHVKEVAQTIADSPLNWSALVTSMANVARQLADKISSNVITDYYRSEGDYPFAQSGPTVVFDSEESQWVELARMWARSSMLMGKLVHSMAGHYFHCLQPNQYYGFKTFTPEEQASAFSEVHPYREGAVKGYPHLVKLGRYLENTINFRDLTQLFAGFNETLYIDSCCHTNDKGNKIITAAIADFIRERWTDYDALRTRSYSTSPLYQRDYSYK